MRLVELLPALDSHLLFGGRAVDLIEHLVVGVLVFAQVQADDVDTLGDRVSRWNQPQPMSRVMPGSRFQLVQCQLALRVLRLFQSYRDVRSRQLYNRGSSQSEELVRFVVVGIELLRPAASCVPLVVSPCDVIERTLLSPLDRCRRRHRCIGIG